MTTRLSDALLLTVADLCERARRSRTTLWFLSTTSGLPSISSSWRQTPWDSRPSFFQLNTCFHSPYVTFSLTGGWVCSLQLLVVLASTVILRYDSCGTRDHILLSQIRDPPEMEGQIPVFKSPRNWVAQLYPEVLGSLSDVPQGKHTASPL
jgi:hypothetical protein